MADSRLRNSGVDRRAMQIFSTAIDELGGPAALVEHGEMPVLPALMESAYVLVLHEEEHRPDDEIADTLGISVGAVHSVFEAPLEASIERIRYRHDELREFEPHEDPEREMPASARLEPEFLAGALAKFAYSVVKRREFSGAP